MGPRRGGARAGRAHRLRLHRPGPRDVHGALHAAVEVGWRLARWAWGHGCAAEAASRAVEVAFDDLGLDEVVSFHRHDHLRSQAVMRRIGLHQDPRDDVDHPRVPVGSPLRRHVLHRVAAERAR